MTTLHLGTRDAEALIALLPAATGGYTVFRDGDSWEEWGEGINHLTPASQLDPHDEDQQRMARHPEHIVIRGNHDTGTPEFLQDIAYILQQDPGLLVPMEYLNQAGTVAVISPDGDWSVPHYVLIDDAARIKALGACTHPADQLIPVTRSAYSTRLYCRACHREFTPEGGAA